MKKALFISMLTFISMTLLAQQEKYAKIKIKANDVELNNLRKLGITLDHGEYKKGYSFTSDFSATEVKIMQENNVDFEILIDDVSQYYQDRNKNYEKSDGSRSSDCNAPGSGFVTPSGFILGSTGGFFTYQEYLNHIDSMFAKYPNLITQKQAIDTFSSREGLPIYWMKISDNPNTDETEPEILYTSIHHAREPASLSQTIMYMYYLLENYGTNEEVTNIVNNTEMYFIPLVNPDGYIFNETTNPNGGGMWRKNRRNNGGGTMGVDLNRNYGFEWGLDDQGSSPSGSSDTYRGPTAFSEPEIQAVKYFCENHEFKMTLNYHTYGNLLIYPWGYAYSSYTPDSASFVEFAKILTEDNNYKYGTGDQTVGYITNGDSDDWMYGAENILSFTPEAGESTDGFWPQMNRIETISKANLRQNLNLANLVGKYARVNDLTDARILTPNSNFTFNIRRLGLDATATFNVGITAISNAITSVGSNVNFAGMDLLELQYGSIAIAIDPATPTGTTIQFILSVDNGDYTSNDTITKIYGEGTIVLQDKGIAMDNWTLGNNSNWGVTTSQFYTSPSSISDSPNGDYGNNSNTSIVLKDSIDLSYATDAFISFRAKWAIETGFDYAQLLASVDGTNWTPLCGKYTQQGNNNQDQGKPVYQGFQTDWVKEEISLNDYLGAPVWLRFKLKSDGGVREDGFYFDELLVKTVDSTNIDTAGVANGVWEQKNGNNIAIYPNPTNGNITISGLKPNAEIRVLNTLGQVVFTTTSISNQLMISLLDKPNGIYFIQINGTVLKKVMKTEF